MTPSHLYQLSYKNSVTSFLTPSLGCCSVLCELFGNHCTEVTKQFNTMHTAHHSKFQCPLCTAHSKVSRQETAVVCKHWEWCHEHTTIVFCIASIVLSFVCLVLCTVLSFVCIVSCTVLFFCV